MVKSCTYHISVRNGVDDIALNAASPVKVSAAQVAANETLLVARIDQSGLIGLLRYLHQQGYTLLSVVRES